MIDYGSHNDTRNNSAISYTLVNFSRLVLSTIAAIDSVSAAHKWS